MAKITSNKDFISPLKLKKCLRRKVITHAVKTEKALLKILKEKIIKIPSKNGKIEKTTPHMEELLGIHDCVYLAPGFDYNATYHNWDFAFMFNKKILLKRHVIFFKTLINFISWMNYLNYLKKNDSDYLLEIRKKGKIQREMIDRFFDIGVCMFWLFEKTLHNSLTKHKDKNKIIKYLKKEKKKYEIEGQKAIDYMSRHYLRTDTKSRMEIISMKDIIFDDNFMGLYIRSNKVKKLLPKIKKIIDKKILIYDGKKTFWLMP